MATYNSDGRKLLECEYDYIPQINDIIDSMRVLSVHDSGNGEVAVFLLEPTTRVTCYIFDEIFIIGKGDSYDSLGDAIEAFKDGEI